MSFDDSRPPGIPIHRPEEADEAWDSDDRPYECHPASLGDIALLLALPAGAIAVYVAARIVGWSL